MNILNLGGNNMLYYQLHLPEQSAKIEAFRLSVTEEGVLSRLSRVYVYTELPIPTEEKELFKIIGGKTKEYRDALCRILSLFFRRTEAGYVNCDLDRNISEAKKKQDRAKMGAEAKHEKAREKDNAQEENEQAPASVAPANREQRTDNNIKPQKRCTSVHPKNPPLTDEISSSEKISKKTSGKKIPLPDDFRVTEEIRNWYETRMLTESTWKPEDLPNFFDAFVAYCKANDKRYVDHYASLRNCIIGDWGGVRKQRIAEERNNLRDFRYKSGGEIIANMGIDRAKELRGNVYDNEGAVDRSSNGEAFLPIRNNLFTEVDIPF